MRVMCAGILTAADRSYRWRRRSTSAPTSATKMARVDSQHVLLRETRDPRTTAVAHVALGLSLPSLGSVRFGIRALTQSYPRWCPRCPEAQINPASLNSGKPP